MNPLLSRSALMLALAACGGGNSDATDVADTNRPTDTDNDTGTAVTDDPGDTDLGAPTGDTGDAPGLPASLTLLAQGEPLVGAPVAVHLADGALREVLTTNDDGIVTIEDVPEEGVGVTVSYDVFAAHQGLATVFGVHAGDALTWGTLEPVPQVRVDYTLPAADAGADRFLVRAGCGMHTAYAPGATGSTYTQGACAVGDTVDVTATALDASGAPLAYAVLRDLPVVADDPYRTATADFSGVAWRTDLAEITVVAAQPPRDGFGLLQIWSPSRTTTLDAALLAVPVEAGAPASAALPMVPGLGGTFESSVLLGGGNEEGESLFTRVFRADPVEDGAVVITDLTADTPTWMEGVGMNASRTAVSVAQPGTGSCAGAEIDATLHTLRGSIGEQHLRWQILTAGDAGTLLPIPELDETFADAWPNEELHSLRVEVLRAAHTALSAADWLAAPDPFLAVQFPAVASGERACLSSVSGEGV